MDGPVCRLRRSGLRADTPERFGTALRWRCWVACASMNEGSRSLSTAEGALQLTEPRGLVDVLQRRDREVEWRLHAGRVVRAVAVRVLEGAPGSLTN